MHPPQHQTTTRKQDFHESQITIHESLFAATQADRITSHQSPVTDHASFRSAGATSWAHLRRPASGTTRMPLYASTLVTNWSRTLPRAGSRSVTARNSV